MVVIISEGDFFAIINHKVIIVILELGLDLLEFFGVFGFEVSGNLLARGLHLLLVNLTVLEAGHIVDVESLEESNEVKVLNVGGA
jgi:hypothetical protein